MDKFNKEFKEEILEQRIIEIELLSTVIRLGGEQNITDKELETLRRALTDYMQLNPNHWVSQKFPDSHKIVRDYTVIKESYERQRYKETTLNQPNS